MTSSFEDCRDSFAIAMVALDHDLGPRAVACATAATDRRGPRPDPVLVLTVTHMSNSGSGQLQRPEGGGRDVAVIVDGQGRRRTSQLRARGCQRHRMREAQCT